MVDVDVQWPVRWSLFLPSAVLDCVIQVFSGIDDEYESRLVRDSGGGTNHAWAWYHHAKCEINLLAY